MSKHARTRYFTVARIFMACTTVVVLTMTIMHREDYDGYQATHLFFMPRHTWEMDHGRGMLHEEEHYAEMDLRMAAEQVFAWSKIRDSDEPYEREHGYEYDEYGRYAEDEYSRDVFSTDLGIPAFHKMPFHTEITEHQIPLAQMPTWELLIAGLLFAIGLPARRPTIWLADVPSPPPRRDSST